MTQLKRSPSWEHVLDTYLRAHASDAFAWGKNDCCLFAASVIEELTGTDIASDFRGKYATSAEAFALITAVTKGATVADACSYCAQKYGLREWIDSKGAPLPLKAQRGDLVAVVNSDGKTIAGIVDLAGKVACMGPDGIVRLSILRAKRAWKV